MIYQDGVNLSEVIVDIKTGNHWSASKIAYKILGDELINYEEIGSGIDWVSLIYNKKKSSSVFLKICVDWDAQQWLNAKNLASKQHEFSNLNDKKDKLADLGIIDDDDNYELQSEFLTALSRENGMVVKACAKAQIPMATYRKWMQLDSDFAEMVSEVRELVKDQVVGALIKNAKKGDDFAIKYFLDSQARDRGFGKETTTKSDDDQELDLSKLTYEEQDVLHKLIVKAQPNQQGKSLRIEHR